MKTERFSCLTWLFILISSTFISCSETKIAFIEVSSNHSLSPLGEAHLGMSLIVRGPSQTKVQVLVNLEGNEIENQRIDDCMLLNTLNQSNQSRSPFISEIETNTNENEAGSMTDDLSLNTFCVYQPLVAQHETSNGGLFLVEKSILVQRELESVLVIDYEPNREIKSFGGLRIQASKYLLKVNTHLY